MERVVGDHFHLSFEAYKGIQTYLAQRLTDRIPAGKRYLEPDISTNPGISISCLRSSCWETVT